MRNTLAPVLFLATVALSSSNILPIVSMREKPDLRYGQSNDNIFSSKPQTSDTSNLFYKIDFQNSRPDVRKLFENDYANLDNNVAEENNPPNKDIYDVKGFRKEQWHNYPRQLDRLNKYLYEHFNSDKRNLEPDDPGEYNDESPQNDITSNEIHLDDSFDPRKPEDEADKAAALINPLIVLKIHLACLNKDVQISRFPDRVSRLVLNQLGQNENEDYASNLSDDIPKSVGKVKREGRTKLEIADSTQHEPKNRMKKRIFSLWSRLQSLNHKGHELHHRRHLYALYGLPDSEGGGGGGVLTAETRATFMRPPGSPLRWG